MRLNKPRKKLLADFFQKFALAIATATAVRLLFDTSETYRWVFLLAAVVVIVMLAIALILSEDDNLEKMHTEVKKGVFHIQNANVTA